MLHTLHEVKLLIVRYHQLYMKLKRCFVSAMLYALWDEFKNGVRTAGKG